MITPYELSIFIAFYIWIITGKKDNDVSGHSVFDHLTKCDIRDSSDCKVKTDGIFDACQTVRGRNGNAIDVCVPKLLGCDSNIHCNTIGSPRKEGSLRGECVTGLCQYQTFLTFNW